MNELEMYNKYRTDIITERLLRNKVLILDRIDIMVNESVITIHGYTYIPTEYTLVSLILSTSIPLTKERVLKATEVPINNVEYISFGDMYLNANSSFSGISLGIFNYIKGIFCQWRNEYEEFQQAIIYNLPDYLKEHPEEDYV